jgi:hypothetical protein
VSSRLQRPLTPRLDSSHGRNGTEDMDCWKMTVSQSGKQREHMFHETFLYMRSNS